MKRNSIHTGAFLMLILATFFCPRQGGLMAQNSEDRIVVSGNIISGDELDNLPGVHIIGRLSRAGTVSDVRGMFRIRIFPEDTLIFSFVGYKTEKITFQDYGSSRVEVVVRLKPDVRELEGVVIYSEHVTPEYLLRPKREPIFIPGLRPPRPKEDVADVPIGSTSYGPISFFSKEAKEKRLVMKSYENKKREQVYNQVINSEPLRMQFMDQYGLSRKEWDDFVVYFNRKPLFHMDRQNSEDIVLNLHREFRLYMGLRYYD